MNTGTDEMDDTGTGVPTVPTQFVRKTTEVSEPKRTMMDTIHEAVMRGTPIEVIRELMTMHKEFEAGQARKAFDAAMADAKKELPIIEKKKHVGFNAKGGGGRTDYDHEDLAAVVSIVSPILGHHGLSHRFRVEQGTAIKVICIISHRDGHSEESELSGAPDNTGNKNSIQAVGSTITYLQRYLIKAALGLAAGKDDDGGNADSQAEPEKISQDQLGELVEIADEVEANKASFVSWLSRRTGCEIDSFANIPAKHFETAKSALESKRGATSLRVRGDGVAA